MPLHRPAVMLVMERLFGGIMEADTDVVTVGTSVVELIGDDFERTSVGFVNLGAAAVLIATDREVSTTRGIRLAPLGGGAFFDVFEDGILPAVAWHAVSAGVGNAVTVMRVKRDVRFPEEGS